MAAKTIVAPHAYCAICPACRAIQARYAATVRAEAAKAAALREAWRLNKYGGKS